MIHFQSQTFLKLIMLLSMELLITKAFTPPYKGQPSDKIVENSSMERNVILITKYLTIPSVLLPGVIQCFVILLKTLPHASLLPETMDICPLDVNDELHRLSPLFIAIFCIMIAASYLRLQCFKALGEFFTLQVTIRPNHKIIDVGPYAVVRHPSYTGVYCMYAGAVLWAFSSQNPVITCGWAGSLVAIVVAVFWLSYLIVSGCRVAQRIPYEEENLKVHFQQDWDDYAERVRYRLIPWLL